MTNLVRALLAPALYNLSLSYPLHTFTYTYYTFTMYQNTYTHILYTHPVSTHTNTNTRTGIIDYFDLLPSIFIHPYTYTYTYHVSTYYTLTMYPHTQASSTTSTCCHQSSFTHILTHTLTMYPYTNTYSHTRKYSHRYHRLLRPAAAHHPRKRSPFHPRKQSTAQGPLVGWLVGGWFGCWLFVCLFVFY